MCPQKSVTRCVLKKTYYSPALNTHLFEKREATAEGISQKPILERHFLPFLRHTQHSFQILDARTLLDHDGTPRDHCNLRQVQSPRGLTSRALSHQQVRITSAPSRLWFELRERLSTPRVIRFLSGSVNLKDVIRWTCGNGHWCW